MRQIAKPNVDNGAFYLECAQSTADAGLRTRLVQTAAAVSVAAAGYIQAGHARSSFQLAHSIQVVPASDDELRNLYARVVVPRRRVGRKVYDKIIIGAPFGICPLCGAGKVSTVDHYLPKSVYAQFSILSENLVPSCADCNKAKLESYPTTPQDQPFHPYFDSVEADRWLFGEVVTYQGVSVAFSVEPPGQWSAILAARARRHFELFRLGEFYATLAAQELSEVRGRLEAMYQQGGADLVRDDLQLSADSAREVHINSWKTAMYDALAQDDEFCEGGFQNIGL
jgi:hypothetical protein